MNEDQLLATADVETVDAALAEYGENASILVHPDMLTRMMEHFPDIFTKQGEDIRYRSTHAISVHNGEDGAVEVMEVS
ncbi:hypothetical protein QWY14_12835 [Planococcus sp. N028]|uniref:Uncharacterized protein n=1 Tax=Planococcus shixiaomingii TaxID=3058393 RepID=A0ABT8N480_9BACL|nr:MULTISPECIES: hypothetical protein [unclassified Planococcus (in: firmicutes)]MDN7242691.1 hypothetical protein [Planococcus sp. N028]WKA55680.1 hypothetical protein QWY21_04620 [Planococcus sp. N022]